MYICIHMIIFFHLVPTRDIYHKNVFFEVCLKLMCFIFPKFPTEATFLAKSSNRTKRHLGKNEFGPDSYVSDNSLSFGPY